MAVLPWRRLDGLLHQHVLLQQNLNDDADAATRLPAAVPERACAVVAGVGVDQDVTGYHRNEANGISFGV